ncbi:hypothetical protein B0H14DRAFT_3873413 [Mycena olivaceomarginata]|nr:hypothetical protein B0H14DRAFT_3873413 [Mycena olivaceomarginata]
MNSLFSDFVMSPTANDSPSLARRRTKSLLNKLAESNFDSISSQLITLIREAVDEDDSGHLTVVVPLIIIAAEVQPERAALYARLCRILMDNINRSMRNAEGKPVVGARLFRKILWDGLQGEFEKGRNNMQEKCRFLGLVRFMAELFRVPMLTERIMCESINVLLSNVEYALVNGIEAACVLLDTAGSLLDNPRTHAHMEAYFSRMQEFESDVHIPNRIRFLIQDLCNRRTRNWAPRHSRYFEYTLPPDADPEGEKYINDATLSEKIDHIFGPGKATNAERVLAHLHPECVPTLVKLLVDRAISAETEHVTCIASRFLGSASSKDLFLTSAVNLGFIMALKDRRLQPNAIPYLRSLLDAAGLQGERGDAIVTQALALSSRPFPRAHVGLEQPCEDSDYVYVNPRTTEIFSAITRALSLSDVIIESQGRFHRSLFDDWLSKIMERDTELSLQRRDIRDLKSEVEHMSSELAKSVDHISKAERERDVMEQARNSEQMRRAEITEQLKARQTEVLVLQTDLRQMQAHCRELDTEVQRARANEQAGRDTEIISKNAAREEGRDVMLTEIIQLLNSKRENERRVREAEMERVEKEKADKIRREAEAERKAEREQGTQRERSRCVQRDQKYTSARWTAALAFERFETILIAEEFSKFKFSDSTPLTFEALPWPVLSKPWTYTAQHITGDHVRAFFKAPTATAARSEAYPAPGTYRKYLLKQALLAFHGDKMVTRISTVDDEALRQQILTAANTVTQILNELLQHPG